MAEKVILFASPIFFLLIALELAWGLAKGRNTYRLNDAVNSISLGILSQVTAIFGRSLRIGMYVLAYQWTQPWAADLSAFWTTPFGWILALIFYDFCYYWLHRLGHECAILWAAHVVHHQSQDYNLSTALRQTSSGFLLGWIFYLPMALAGLPPEVFAVVALIDLLYQFWVHTEHIGKLGWFDRVFCSPSNHRVHHAINDRYLDRNYGGILVIWDRLFGSFQEEDETCVYGTRSPLNSWNPIWANLEVYVDLAKQAWHTPRWQDKLLIWIKPPGWKPNGRLKGKVNGQVSDQANREKNDYVTAHLNGSSNGNPEGILKEPTFNADPGFARPTRFDPPISRIQARLALLGFFVVLIAATVFLDQVKKIPFLTAAFASLAIILGAWLVGRLLEPQAVKIRARSKSMQKADPEQSLP